MPLYYFQLDSRRPFVDDQGVEFPDDHAAWKEAKRFVRDIETDLEPGEVWRLEVRRDNRPLFALIVSSHILA
jgi:hypothetical protein